MDDEARVLSGIENSLIFDGDDLVATFACSGAEAVAALATSEFHVLVTDMKMPGMTGADLLEHARDHHPTVARVVLSGEVDPDLAQRAMPLTHEFVTKPCDPAALFEIVRDVFRTSRSLDSPIVAELVGGLAGLPVQPRVFGQIQAAIAGGGGLQEVAAVVESDIGIATSVLRTANSAFYGFRSPAASVQSAVGRLGATAVAGIALNAELSVQAPDQVIIELETLNELASNVARIVNKMVGQEFPQASLTALLRSIGVVVLQVNMTDQFRPIQDHFNLTGEVDEAAELRVFGASHGQIGAYVLRMWKVDPIVVEAVQFHRHVNAATSPEARRIIHAMAAADAALDTRREVPNWIDDDLVAIAQAVVRASADAGDAT